jgi:glucokinase
MAELAGPQPAQSGLAGAVRGNRQPASSRAPGYAIAVDIGGTKIAAGAVGPAGQLDCTMAVPTPRDDLPALLDAVADLVRGVRAAVSALPAGVAVSDCPAGLGVSVAGAVDPDSGDVHYAPNIPALQETPLQRLLSDATGLPVVVGFDGHLTALGEHWIGAGRGTRNMVLLTVGTGIGGGLILDGKLCRGSDNLAGAAGWMIADPARLGAAGSLLAGNLESVSAGPAIAAAATALAGTVPARPTGWVAGATPAGTAGPAGIGDRRDGGGMRAEDVLAAARAGDEVTRAVLDEAGRALGYAVTSIVSLLNPEKVIIGGGLGSTGVFLDQVREAVAAYAQPTSRSRVVIETAALGADAALVGAACAVFEAVRT